MSFLYYLCNMKLRFSIHYSTVWGQSMHVAIDYHYVDGRKRSYDLLMSTENGELWTVETSVIESRQHPVEYFGYTYLVEDGDGKVMRREWNRVPRRYHFDSTKDYIMPDLWRDIPLQYHLMTKLCRVCENRPVESAESGIRLPLYRKTIIFRVQAPQLEKGQILGICGNHPSLGNWNPTMFLRMRRSGEDEWTLSVNVDNVMQPLEFKYVVVDGKTNRIVEWEQGDNRKADNMKLDDGQVLVLYGENLRIKERNWKAAGVVVPLFSLRTDHSFGVGDFGDLKRFVDWTEATGMKVIQLLPVFDTTTTHTWSDSHPYDCISLHAIHPHYIDLEQLGSLDDESEQKVFNRQRRELNALEYSDYEAVDRLKSRYVYLFFRKNGEADMATDEYKEFARKNRSWLYPYAAFCALREHFHTARTSDWHEFSTYNEEKLRETFKSDEHFHEEFCLACYTQYHLHRQFKKAVDYAYSKEIGFCGDLPVSLYRDSVATWHHPELFHLDMKLGNPPSNEEPQGQNWGMPPFDWYPDDGRKVAGYLNDVICGMEEYFDAVRIDHVVSFFRSWEIPEQNLWTSMGHFSPSIPVSEIEIREYGLDFHKELYTKPFINDYVLYQFFGIHADYVRENFLNSLSYHLYSLKPEYDTQLKIKRYFEGRNDENSQWIRDGLMHLCANVLFLEDPYREGMYYPRYGVYNEPVYSILSPESRDAFMRLYNNFYYERHNAYWESLAKTKLDMVLRGTHVLVCAEDLGMLPACVPSVLDQKRILSLEVQSMPKRHGEEFAHLESYPYRSVAVPTTHDMSPLRLWWEENPARTQHYWKSMLQKDGRAPRHLPPMIAEEIITRHLYCPSMICMMSIQDWLSMDSNFNRPDLFSLRINAPYDAYNQWKFRMKPTIDDLLSADQFNYKIKTMITRSFRNNEELEKKED